MPKQVAEVESGAGVFAAIVTSLVTKVREKGGDVGADFHRLVKPEGAAVIEQIAELIIRAGRTITKVLWTLVSDGRDAATLTETLKAKGRRISSWTAQVMATPEFADAITDGVTYKLVGIRGDEFADNQQRTTANVFAEAKRRSYRKPPAFLAALLREKFTQEELDAPHVVVMHEPIVVDGFPNMLGLDRRDCVGWLDGWDAFPGRRWGRDFLFLFLAPQD